MQLGEVAGATVKEGTQWCAECGLRLCRDSQWWCSEECFYEWQRTRWTWTA